MTHRPFGVTAKTLITGLLVLTAGASAWQYRGSTVLTAEAAAEQQNIVMSGVPADRSPEVYTGSFLYRSADDMLAAQNVSVYPEDKVFAFPDPALGFGSTVSVYRATPVMIHDGAADISVRTWATTVAELIASQDLDLSEKDVVMPAPSTAIKADASDLAITITRVAETQLTITKSIDYATVYKDDAELEKGKTVTDQAGQKGSQQFVYRVRKENGVEVSRKLLEQKVTKPAVQEVIRRGTKIITYGTGGASWYGGVPALTAAHKTLPMGTKVRVVNVANGKSVVVTIADRGPFVAGRIIDLSKDAFSAIGSIGAGVASVRLEKVY